MQTAITIPTGGPIAPFLAALCRRWPTMLAIGVAATLWGVDTVTAAQLLPVLPLLYLVLFVLRRPEASWPALLVSVVALSALEVQDVVEPVLAVTALAGLVVLASAVRPGRPGKPDERGGLAWQIAGYVVFAGAAAVALLVAPEVARWVLAAGWLGHGAWDLVHLRRREVVSPSYAEWCATLDVLVAFQLVFVP